MESPPDRSGARLLPGGGDQRRGRAKTREPVVGLDQVAALKRFSASLRALVRRPRRRSPRGGDRAEHLALPGGPADLRTGPPLQVVRRAHQKPHSTGHGRGATWRYFAPRTQLLRGVTRQVVALVALAVTEARAAESRPGRTWIGRDRGVRGSRCSIAAGSAREHIATNTRTARGTGGRRRISSARAGTRPRSRRRLAHDLARPLRCSPTTSRRAVTASR